MAEEDISFNVGSLDESMENIQSPSKVMRCHEKEQLQGLNGRLAVFMDRIQFVRDQNDELRDELKKCKDTHRREMDSHRTLFERELAEARKLLDETAREKAKFELASSRNSSQAADHKIKLEEEILERTHVEELLTTTERDLQMSRHRVEELEKDQKKQEERVSQLTIDVETCRQQTDVVRTDLESEMVARVNAQNNCQSLHEEIAFSLSVHNQEKADLNGRLAAVEKEYATVRHAFEKELKLRVAQALASARDERDKESDRIRAELDQLYMCKLKEANDRHERDMSTLHSLNEDNSTLASKNHHLSEDNASLTAKVAQLSKQLDSREYERVRERDHYRCENDRLQKDLEGVQHELSSKLTEFADLMDVNIRLDKEISRYHRLLYEQEKKVGLDGGLLSAPGSAQKSRKVYDSPLGRPLPPPLSTLPRGMATGESNESMGMPLSAAMTTQAREASNDDGVATASSIMSASSLISFFTGIGRKRRRGGEDDVNDSAHRSGTEQTDGTVAAAVSERSTHTAEDFSMAICSDGQFVKVTNNLSEDVTLAGWRLEKQAQKKPLVYRFPKSVVLPTAATATVWCSGNGPAIGQRTPLDCVARHVTSWTDDSNETPLILLDADGMARCSEINHSSETVNQDATPHSSPSKKKVNVRRSSMSPQKASRVTSTHSAHNLSSCAASQSAITTTTEETSSQSTEQETLEAVSAASYPTITVQSATKPSAKSHRSRTARAGRRSKSPSRKNLAKSLSTVAIAPIDLGTNTGGSDTDEQSSAEAGNDDVIASKMSRRSSMAASVKSSKIAVMRRLHSSSHATTTAVHTTSADMHMASSGTSTRARTSSDSATHAAFESAEEIFHEQGDPGKENCVIC